MNALNIFTAFYLSLYNIAFPLLIAFRYYKIDMYYTKIYYIIYVLHIIYYNTMYSRII